MRVKKKERDKELTECGWWTRLCVEALHVRMVSMQMLGSPGADEGKEI